MTTAKERRVIVPGRRESDKAQCAEHCLIQETNKEHRTVLCTKITEIKANLSNEVDRLEKVDDELKAINHELELKIEMVKDSLVGKYWFRVVVGGLCAALLYIAAQNRFSNMDQTETLKNLAIGQKEIIVVVNNIENKQIEVVQKIKAFESEIEQINKRQDVLRDAHMKIMQDKK